MANFQVIEATRHAGRRWSRHTSYAFAAKDGTVPLVISELPTAMIALPIAFIERGEGFTPVAVLGLSPDKNLFVAKSGKWAAGYIPAAMRAYPFRLARTKDGQRVLCVDEDSALVSDGPDGERFFLEGGEAAPGVRDIFNLLVEVERGAVATEAACALLHKHKLIRPWNIAHKTEAGMQKIEGLFQIDEAALNALPAAEFGELRQGGAMLLAYCQLLSMQHFPQLGKLVQAHAQVDARERAQAVSATAPARDLDLNFLNDGGNISFGNLG